MRISGGRTYIMITIITCANAHFKGSESQKFMLNFFDLENKVMDDQIIKAYSSENELEMSVKNFKCVKVFEPFNKSQLLICIL